MNNQKPISELLEFSILNIDKPSGPTSFDISDFVRKTLGVRKTSHFGTLDPKVTGVLPIALNRACKLTGFFLGHNKEYVGIMRIHEDVELEKIKKLIKEKFLGKIKQTPPVKSRVKRQEREREIISFDLLEKDGKDILFKAKVQGGTYIRKLCLHPNTEILTNEGIIKIKDLHLKPSKIYSFNNKMIDLKEPTEIQKITAPNKLFKLKMSSGIEIIVTADHKMLTSTIDGYKMVECQRLKLGDYIAKSEFFPLKTINYYVADLLDDDYLIEDNEIKKECKKAMIEKFGSIREMNRKLKLDRKVFLSNSKSAISIKHLKLAGIYEKIKDKLNKFKTPKGKIIEIDKLTSEHFYLLGLIASDGNNTKEKKTKRFTRIKFHNMNETLIDKFYDLYKKLFPYIKISKKKIKNNLFQLDTSNSLFASISANLGIVSPNKYSDILPILYCRDEFIRAFLRGYFDGDGTTFFKKKDKTTYTTISFCSSNFNNAKRIHQMLLKLGIQSNIFKQREGMYSISLHDIRDKKLFINEIGTNHPKKLIIFEKMNTTQFRNPIRDSRYVGLHYKEFIKKNKSKLCKKGGNLGRILNSPIPITREFYNSCSKIVDLPSLDNMTIEKIKKIEIINPDNNYVYDMTIPLTHNFLIETGYISSNCDDLGKEIGGAHMLELRRTNAGIFSEDDDNFIDLYKLEKIAKSVDLGDNKIVNEKSEKVDKVESSIKEDNRLIDNNKGVGEQLHNIASKNRVGLGEGAEQELRKILIPAEEALKKIFPVVQVKEESVKRLLTGKPIMREDLADKNKVVNNKIDSKIKSDWQLNKSGLTDNNILGVGNSMLLGGAKINDNQKFIAFCGDKFIGIYDNGKPLFVLQEIKK